MSLEMDMNETCDLDEGWGGWEEGDDDGGGGGGGGGGGWVYAPPQRPVRDPCIELGYISKVQTLVQGIDPGNKEG